MEKINYSKTSPEVIEIKQLIARQAGFPVRTPADFNMLIELIEKKTGELLSPSTLKRLWGYIDGADIVRPSTLNILAKYIGFASWEVFVSYFNNNLDSESNEVIGECIQCNSLTVNQKVEITWLPNRRIVILFRGQQLFEVIEAENSKVSVGDTFECNYIILHEPLYVTQLKHDSTKVVNFVMGKKGGIQSAKIIGDYTK